MNHEGDEDCNRIRILHQRDGNAIDKDRDQNSSSSACHDHVDELIREGSFAADRIEHFAALRIGEESTGELR
jgi:hypothetical protein